MCSASYFSLKRPFISVSWLNVNIRVSESVSKSRFNISGIAGSRFWPRIQGKTGSKLLIQISLSYKMCPNYGMLILINKWSDPKTWLYNDSATANKTGFVNLGYQMNLLSAYCLWDWFFSHIYIAYSMWFKCEYFMCKMQ